MMRRPRQGAPRASNDLVLGTIDRLMREKAELMEEVRQLRAAVRIYQRLAEQASGQPVPELGKTGTR
jgi:hypothetical protein